MRFNATLQPAIHEGWKELLNKVPRTRVNGTWYGRGSAGTTQMYWQYHCHQVAAPWKDAWNLEPWRKRGDMVNRSRSYRWATRGLILSSVATIGLGVASEWLGTLVDEKSLPGHPALPWLTISSLVGLLCTTVLLAVWLGTRKHRQCRVS